MSTDAEQGPARDEQIVRYLLGELSEEERSRLEGLYFADPDLLERLVAAKEVLIDDYVGGRLSGRRLELFESHFLASPERRRRVETAKAVRAHVLSSAGAAGRATAGAAAPDVRRGATLRKPPRAWRRAPAPALRYSLAALAVATLLGLAVWFASRPGGVRRAAPPEDRVARQTEARPAPPNGAHGASAPEGATGAAPTQDADQGERASAEAGGGSAAGAARRAPDAPRHGAAGPVPAPARAAAVAALALTSVHTRGAGRPNTLFIPRGAGRVSLRLLFGESRHTRYDARVQTVEGAEVGAARGLRPRKTARAQSVSLSLPAALFTRNDYIITLSGVTAEGGLEKVGEYYLQVRRDAPPAEPARRARP